jgi:hypothetical protein
LAILAILAAQIPTRSWAGVVDREDIEKVIASMTFDTSARETFAPTRSNPSRSDLKDLFLAPWRLGGKSDPILSWRLGGKSSWRQRSG